MAGGIDWFRWHHGSITDPKFQLVAKKAGARFGDVMTVWAFILENASADQDRGSIVAPDFESVDFLLGADDGTTARILDAMTARGLIADGRISSWEKRQPKREDETSAERKRRQRERDHEIKLAELVTNEQSRNVTQCHDRGEERREEENKPSTATPVGFAEFWEAYPKKTGKIAALKAWKKNRPNLSRSLSAIAMQKETAGWRKDGGQYIPNPATWLNEGRWDDEPTTEGSSGSTGFVTPKNGDIRNHPQHGAKERFVDGRWVLTA